MLLFPQHDLIYISIINLAIGAWVLFKKPRSLVHQAFFIFVLGISSWILGVTLLYLTHDFAFNTLALGGGLLTFLGMSLFAYVFPSRELVSRRFLLFLLPLVAAFALLPLHLFIRGISIDSQGMVQPLNGPLFPLYAVIGLTYFVLTPLYLFKRNYQKADVKARIQMLYLGIGVLAFIVCSISFDILLPSIGIYQLNAIGPATSLIFVFMASYAIVRHQLMDIRVAIQRGVIYSMLLSIIIFAYLCLLYLSESFLDAYEEVTTPVFAGIIMIVGILTIPHIERYFRRITDRLFFKDHYDYADAMEKLSSVLNANTQLTDMVFQLLQELNSVFRPNNVAFTHVSTKTRFENGKQSIVEDIPELSTENGLRIMVSARDRTIGCFTFEQKRSGDSYTNDDLKLLRTFAEQAAVAFEKAELYQRLQGYSRSLEKKVQARTQKLVQMQEHQRQLFDDISHALQTPLTVLKGAMELLKTDLPSEEIRTVESMEHGVDDLSRLIREILQLARIDATQTETESSLINLSQLVEDVIEYVEVVCRQNQIDISSELEPNITMHGDQKQLEEVLTNLLSNAVHYTAGCPRREIFVTLKKNTEHIELIVKDSGIGIAPERIPHIFDRFYRAHEREESAKTGYGLGLAIVKRIVEKHAGTIHAESIPTKGTSMIVRFPEKGDSTSAPQSQI